MEGFRIAFFLFGIFICAVPCSYGITATCMEAYNGGGAPAVLQGPECQNWVQTNHSSQYQNMNCQFATDQGRRTYQEDRISCNIDMQIPIEGKNGAKEIRLGIAAVFDGHIGKEASEMASKLFLDYFSLHTVFAHEEASSRKDKHDMNPEESSEDFGSCKSVSTDESQQLEVLKEALTRTILDIDISFTKEAFQSKLPAGSTAVVALLVDGQILVANVGNFAYLSAKELTVDHTPGRYDERTRIEAAGGVVVDVEGPWLNGMLPMSRAIGDVGLKRYGLIAVPEMTGWLRLESNDTYLVVSSDGIFESLTPQEACDLLWAADVNQSSGPELSSSSPCASSPSLAECIIKTAYKRGSMDNLSVIIVPLRQSAFSETCAVKESCDDG